MAEDDLDIFAEVGAETMLVKTHTITVSGGVLDIELSSLDAMGGARHPVINGIEVLRGPQTQTISLKQADATNESRNFKIYPNQASTLVTASFEESTEIRNILIFDISRRVVKSFNPKEIGNNGEYLLDVSSCQPGAYIVKMVDNEGRGFQRQVIVD